MDYVHFRRFFDTILFETLSRLDGTVSGGHAWVTP
jgi:hypothetical protein